MYTLIKTRPSFKLLKKLRTLFLSNCTSLHIFFLKEFFKVYQNIFSKQDKCVLKLELEIVIGGKWMPLYLLTFPSTMGLFNNNMKKKNPKPWPWKHILIILSTYVHVCTDGSLYWNLCESVYWSVQWMWRL